MSINSLSNKNTRPPFSLKGMEVLGLILSLLLISVLGYRSELILFGIPLLASTYFISKNLMQLSDLKILLPLVGILILGTRVGTGYGIIHILRDYAYFSSPIFSFAMGYVLYKHMTLERFILLLTLLGTLYSLVYLMQITFRFDTVFVGDTEKTRYFVGTGTPFPILAWVFILLGFKYLKKFNINILIWSLFLSINTLAIIYFASRVYYFTILLFFFPLLYVILIGNNKLLGKVLFYIAATISVLVIFTLLQGDNFLAEKMRNSLTEMFMQNFDDYDSVIHNWRAYELFEAVKTFMNAGWTNKIIGFGFGKTVYLEYELLMPLLTISEIPIFHNGFAYLLVKTGIIGICLELLFSYMLLYKSYKYYKLCPDLRFEFYILFSSILSFNFSLLVVNGLFSGESAILVILSGFMYSRLKNQATTLGI